MWELNVLTANGSQHGLGWSFDDLSRLGIKTAAIFLGLSEEEAYFAVDITKEEGPVRELQETGDWKFEDARAATEFLSGPDSGIVAQARAQINWHNRNGFCSICEPDGLKHTPADEAPVKFSEGLWERLPAGPHPQAVGREMQPHA